LRTAAHAHERRRLDRQESSRFDKDIKPADGTLAASPPRRPRHFPRSEAASKRLSTTNQRLQADSEPSIPGFLVLFEPYGCPEVSAPQAPRDVTGRVRCGCVGRGIRASGSPLTANAPLHRGELAVWARKRLMHYDRRKKKRPPRGGLSEILRCVCIRRLQRQRGSSASGAWQGSQ
jgi:hypothetical protein